MREAVGEGARKTKTRRDTNGDTDIILGRQDPAVLQTEPPRATHDNDQSILFRFGPE